VCVGGGRLGGGRWRERALSSMESKSCWDGGESLDTNIVLNNKKRWGHKVVVDRNVSWFPMKRSENSVRDEAALKGKLCAVSLGFLLSNEL
jgi:hypothetical protein